MRDQTFWEGMTFITLGMAIMSGKSEILALTMGSLVMAIWSVIEDARTKKKQGE